ncbi:hypothetical protein SPW_7291 [Streptomyces sp. W007]|nr:hypothetical protein SPW_7291 [Streptomyces sp. W007]
MASDEEFEELLSRSSLGTPGAQALIAQVPPVVAARTLEVAREHEAEPRPAEGE